MIPAATLAGFRKREGLSEPHSGLPLSCFIGIESSQPRVRPARSMRDVPNGPYRAVTAACPHQAATRRRYPTTLKKLSIDVVRVSPHSPHSQPDRRPTPAFPLHHRLLARHRPSSCCALGIGYGPLVPTSSIQRFLLYDHPSASIVRPIAKRTKRVCGFPQMDPKPAKCGGASSAKILKSGAGSENRTRDIQLGKLGSKEQKQPVSCKADQNGPHADQSVTTGPQNDPPPRKPKSPGSLAGETGARNGSLGGLKLQKIYTIRHAAASAVRRP